MPVLLRFNSNSLSVAMKRLVLPLLCAFALTGCAHQYVMKLNNGTNLTCASKPKLVGNDYIYKDAYGNKVAISSGRVREVESVSQAEDEQKANQFKPVQVETKHWYKFW
jgi:hypothetical protein